MDISLNHAVLIALRALATPVEAFASISQLAEHRSGVMASFSIDESVKETDFVGCAMLDSEAMPRDIL